MPSKGTKVVLVVLVLVSEGVYGPANVLTEPANPMSAMHSSPHIPQTAIASNYETPQRDLKVFGHTQWEFSQAIPTGS